MTTIRPEEARDEAAVRRVNLEAFGAPGEADLVDALRRNGGVTLSLVAGSLAGGGVARYRPEFGAVS